MGRATATTRKGGHVVAALIMKIHAAKVANSATVELWGSGTPKREFLFSEDLADACVFVMKNYSGEMFLNVGTGRDMTILELAETHCPNRRLEGNVHLRQVEARRHAAQSNGREPPASAGLERANRL